MNIWEIQGNIQPHCGTISYVTAELFPIGLWKYKYSQFSSAAAGKSIISS
jgi:hypothetical protein